MQGPEAVVQRAVKHVYTIAGAVVYDLSQGYRPDPGGTRQTPGLPDLWGFLPVSAFRPMDLFWHEVKTEAGLREHLRLLDLPATLVKKSQVEKWRRAQAQGEFRRRCEERGIPYAIGGVDEAKALLMRLGLAHKDAHGVIVIGQRRSA